MLIVRKLPGKPIQQFAVLDMVNKEYVAPLPVRIFQVLVAMACNIKPSVIVGKIY